MLNAERKIKKSLLVIQEWLGLSPKHYSSQEKAIEGAVNEFLKRAAPGTILELPEKKAENNQAETK